MSALLEASMSAGFDALPPALLEAQEFGQPRHAALAAVLADGLPGARGKRGSTVRCRRAASARLPAPPRWIRRDWPAFLRRAWCW